MNLAQKLPLIIYSHRAIKISTALKHQMPKKIAKEVKGVDRKPIVSEAVSELADGRVVIRILAKPGAKQNLITGIQEEVGIQIAAPPVEGAANTELIRYLSSVLGLKRSQLALEKGAKSRNKTVVVSNIDRTAALQKLQMEADESN